ncbi:mucin-17 [Mugil cephalus]|uniref:mucin-17 n=1 Tax=Mugil cephalus TaxID=48193 RepID=UPI001FB68A19|nr:mucin-17 [Mugil cephalus]
MAAVNSRRVLSDKESLCAIDDLSRSPTHFRVFFFLLTFPSNVPWIRGLSQPRSVWRAVTNNNMEALERAAASPHLSADDDVNRPVEQTLISQQSAGEDQRQPRLKTNDPVLQQPGGHSLQLEFQDSNLSPALSLLPAASGVGHNFPEYSLFQQSDTEFAPLRAYPDISMASERFHFPLQDHTAHVSECGSLSQHPLAQATILSEEGEISCSSLSPHSLSPRDQGKQEENTSSADDRQETPPRDETGSRIKEPETRPNPPDKPVGEAVEDETFFLNKDVRAKHLLELLQKDVGVPDSSGSVVSSASETSVKSTLSFTEGHMAVREGPPGEASFSLQQKQQHDRVSNRGHARAPSSEVCNITTGSRSTQPDDSSEELHRQLLSEAESKNKPPVQSVTPSFKEMSEGKPDVIKINFSSVPWTGPFSAGVVRTHREQDLWLSGNQTGIDGSYLGFLPQSQSTPGVFKAPHKSSIKAKLDQLSAIESNKESSFQSSSGVSPQPAVPVEDAKGPDTTNQRQEAGSSEKVQSLPSLNYMEKVDAWRANQSSGKTSLFDNLALQGFSGTSPKNKAYEAVSDKLNRILSQQVKSLQQPLVSGSDNHNVPQSSSTPSALSSPRRGEAVGSTPSDVDNTGSAAPPSASPCGRSQSHSSLSTVVMSARKDQQTDRASEKEASPRQDDLPSSSVQPLNLMSLGHFSDVSLDRDSALSSSQGSYSGVKVGASVGASSVVSLEIDNYAPHWSSKRSTPPPLPKLQELDIDERIPLYLHNLGIDQSPSTILTPFAPRGPIREPEFSPTDLSTVKGSIGTPTKSTQPSEGSSPHKSEFSRSSIVSVDSSISIPFSLDSLGQGVSVPERTKRTSPPSDAEATQRKPRPAALSQSTEDSDSSVTLHHSQQQDSGSTSDLKNNQPRDKFEVSLPVGDKRGERNTGSLLQTSGSLDQSAEESFIGSKALLEIRKLLSQADNMVSSASSAASSASRAAPRLVSDENLFLSQEKKTSRLPESSFSSSSSSAGDLRTHSSHPWTRSSSDSVLTSEKPRQSSVGRENMTSSWQQAFTAGPATITPKTPADSAVSGGAGTSLVLSKSARRTEPEGCSAAPPDAIPTQPPPAASAQQLTSTPVDTAQTREEEDEEERTTPGAPVLSVSPSPVLEESDQGVISDGSSESSLAVRVAKLLQSESPATMMSSTPSVTDQEEIKAREWIKLKVSGQQCEPLELDKEDRRRIEEIKKELLLKNPIKSQSSTDTDTSAASSVLNPKENNQARLAEVFASVSDANKQPHQPPPPPLGPRTNPPLSSTEHLHQDLEAKVCEIAAREGVTLPTKPPRAFTSITISTRRRSTSPSPSTSPAPTPGPLHLTELSTDTPPLEEEERLGVRGGLHPRNVTSPSAAERQDAVGGHFEEPPPPLGRDDGTKRDSRRGDKFLVHNSSQTTSSSAVKSPAGTGHVSHVHLTLSPKVTDQTPSTASRSSHALSRLPREELVHFRHSSSAASSPDEGVGLSSPPEWLDTREPRRLEKPVFKSAASQDKTTTQSFTTRHTPETSPGPFTSETPVPSLLPYKPRGSEELFYVPQTEADVSDTTMESSHSGSDDAVPPHFSSEVLGRQDPGLDRGVAIKHVEGIYSKKTKTSTFRMNEPGHRGAISPGLSQTLKPSSQMSAAFNKVPSLSNQDVSKRDQGTSPIQFLNYDHPEPSRQRFQHLHTLQTSVAQRGRGGQQHRPESSFQRSSSSSSALDQLWDKFCDQWTTEESRPTRDREESLLERLERLSRLIHSTRSTDMSAAPEEEEEERGGYHPEDNLGWRRDDVIMRRTKRKEDTRLHDDRGARGVEPSLTEDDDSSAFSHDSSQSLHLSPAGRDESSETLSTASGSVSTVDTARLIRAFGAHRVQRLKATPSLGKLYGAINRQKEGREQRRGRNTPPLVLTPSDFTGTERSVVADSASSSSTYTVPSNRGPSRTLEAKKAVKLVNKGVQAGDLEIVNNGTRRHTRDVGTTFPSPVGARALGQISPSSSGAVRGRGGRRSPSKSQGVQKQRKSRRSPAKLYPKGVSWFISAAALRSDARKENRPDESSSSRRPSAVWFEPYSRIRPWREPLRQRRVLEDRNEQHGVIHELEPEPEPEPTAKTTSSGLTQVSLQEALEMSRPEFLSRSRQRMKRLALQVEERKLQAVFTRDRDDVFDRLGGAERLMRPPGAALMRRVVPRKEMIQRSKQIYETLPEVQRRREEERRKAEYKSYRLNAQLYNKRITNRVLGRRSAWQ